jgi:N-acetylneuraminic acid mutarotase
VASSEVLKAIATAPNFVPSPVATASYTISLPPAATPTFTPPPGNYSGTQTIQITDSTPNATIFYTTDGSTPTPSSTLYTGALTVNSTETIQAIASAPNFSPGPVAVGTYTFAPPTVATPTFNPPAGNYTVAQSVQILDATPAAQIFYSTDGSVPSMASIQYTGPIPVTSTERINAIAYANPYTASPVATALYNILPPVASNPGQWTWMSGSPNPNDPGSYGTLGAASPSNTPPARYLANGVADQSGGLWLFGGINQFSPANETTASNDLWRFDTTTLEWTWINGSDQAAPVGSYGTQGVASPANQPPPRGASALWIDTTGNLWIFGGLGNKYFDVFEYGDLWEFSPTSGLWTWVGGSNTADSAGTYGTLGVSSPSNIPGAREGAVSCSDAQGNFWLFGGFTNSPNSVGLGSLNDLWRYSPVTHEWTWMAGSSTVNQPGSYGTIGVSSAGNMPGARSGAVCWSGPDGNLWIFGGEGQVTSTSSMSLNDLWNFNPVTLQWTWISGSNLGDPPAVYGTQGTPAASNTPSGRISSAAWVSQGALWLFDGETGNPSAPQVTGDLWRFDVATSQWTWVAGSSSPNEAADYGNLRASSPSTTPGARDGMTPWPDANGVLWLFGGSPSTTGGGMLNDLWRYHP